MIPDTWQDALLESFTEGKIYREALEQWTLQLPDGEVQSHNVRYLSPEETAENLAVFVKRDGIWQEIEADAIGSYLIFTVNGTEAEIAILSTINTWWVWLIPLTLVLLLILLIATIAKHIRRKPQAAPVAKPEEVDAEIERLRAELESIKAKMKEKEGTGDGE